MRFVVIQPLMDALRQFDVTPPLLDFIGDHIYDKIPPKLGFCFDKLFAGYFFMGPRTLATIMFLVSLKEVFLPAQIQ